MSYNLGPVDPDDARAGYPARYGRPRRRLRYVLLAVVAVIFAAGAAMLYRGGRHTTTEGGIPLIQADGNPTKRRPDQPGGMTIPNQDKLIYNPGQTQVERLLPPPEQPLPRPVAPPAPEPSVTPMPPAPATAPIPNAPPQQAEVTPPPAAPPVVVPEPAPVVLTPAVEPPKPASPTPPAARPPVVAAAPATVAPPPTKPTPTPPAAAPAPAAPAPTGKGGYKLQIGAVRSTEEAQKEWDRLKKANADVLGALKADAVRADLGDKGIFYRIQAGTITGEAAAQQACNTLKQRKVGCILVKQ